MSVETDREELTNELQPDSVGGPKYLSLHRVTVFMQHEYKELIEGIAADVMESRPQKRGDPSRERITANTVVRAVLHTLKQIVDELDLDDVDNEDDLKKRISSAFRQKYGEKTARGESDEKTGDSQSKRWCWQVHDDH